MLYSLLACNKQETTINNRQWIVIDGRVGSALDNTNFLITFVFQITKTSVCGVRVKMFRTAL